MSRTLISFRHYSPPYLYSLGTVYSSNYHLRICRPHALYLSYKLRNCFLILTFKEVMNSREVMYIRREREDKIESRERRKQISFEKMKKVEESPIFKCPTKIIDFSTFTPMYPHAIVVDQNVEGDGHASLVRASAEMMTRAPRCSNPNFFISKSISHAFDLIRCHASHGQAEEGWTIVLNEGVYLDPKFCDQLPHLRYELVGLKDVRLLFVGGGLGLSSAQVALRNIRIFGFVDEGARTSTVWEVMILGGPPPICVKTTS